MRFEASWTCARRALRTGWKTVLLSSTAPAVLLVAAPSPALAQAAPSTADVADFNIARQTVNSALVAFARQAGVQLVVKSSTLDGLVSTPVTGRYSKAEALQMLIGSLPLSGEWIGGGNTLVVKMLAPRAQPAAMQSSETVWAQADTRQPAPIAEATAAPSSIEDIVVTARRVAEREQDVPASITAITGEQLQAKQVNSAFDLQYHAPSLTAFTAVNTGGSIGRASPSYALRGLSGNAVAVYFAETLSYRPAVSESAFDLSNVQVLSGPQGTLFGRNTTGGAILYEPTRPKDEFGGYVHGRIGSYSLRDFDGAINLPITEHLAVRLAGRRAVQHGFTKNLSGPDLDDKDVWSLRGSALWTPTDWFESYTIVDYFSSGGNNASRVLIDYTRPTNCAVTVTAASCLYRTAASPGGIFTANADAQLARGIKTVDNGSAGDLDITSHEIINSTRISFGDTFLGDASFRNIFLYRREKFSGTQNNGGVINPINQQQNNVESDVFTEEAQLLGKAGNLNWIVGGFFSGSYDRKPNTTPSIVAPLFVGTPFQFTAVYGLNSYSSTESRAVYGQLSYDFAGVGIDGLKLTAGGRYTWDKSKSGGSDYSQLPSGVRVCALAAGLTVNLATCTRDLKGSWKAPTYTFSLDYEVAKGTLLYATTRRGYQQGGFNPTALATALLTYQPEKVTDYEVGVKSDWRAGSVPIRTNLALFQMDYKDIQRITTSVGVNAITGQTTIQSVVQNAASARIRGFEAEFQIVPVRGLTLGGNYAYLDAKYLDYIRNVLVGGTLVPMDLSANKFAGAPKSTLNLSASYQLTLGDVGDLVLNGNYYHRSSTVFTDSAIAAIPGFGLANASIDLKNIKGSTVSVGVFVKNLTNKRTPISFDDAADSFGERIGVFSEPRIVGVQASASF